jgi:hypothetical protein
MTFQINIEEKKILFTEPFTKHDLEEVLNLLNIDGVEDWKVDVSEDYKSNPQPYIPPTDNTGTGWWQSPYIITSTGSKSINFTSNSSTNELETIYN